MEYENHYNITKQKEELYIIKENISEIHPIYRNDPLNLYLIIGSEKAVLLDTGCGLYPLKPIIKDLIDGRKLIIINTHAHWDHILGNHEFNEVYIHRKEVEIVSHGYSVYFLANSPNEIVKKKYGKYDYLIPPAEKIRTLREGDTFDLGDINIKIIHAPGHSSGSICVLTNTQMLFTGDVAYYGDIFLPKRQNIPKVLDTLTKLINICKKKEDIILFPSHRETPCNISLLNNLYDEIKKINQKWDQKKFNEFFFAWEVDANEFTFYISKS